MNIDFCITKERGLNTLAHRSQWVNEETCGEYSFLRLVWHLWKWYIGVKKQARKSHKRRLENRDMYVFSTRQIFRIETEN